MVQILNNIFRFTRWPPVPCFPTRLGHLHRSWMLVFSRSSRRVPGFRGPVSLSDPRQAGRTGRILGGPCGSVSFVGHGELSNPATQHRGLGWDYPPADRTICHHRLWKHGGERNRHWSWKRSDRNKSKKQNVWVLNWKLTHQLILLFECVFWYGCARRTFQAVQNESDPDQQKLWNCLHVHKLQHYRHQCKKSTSGHRCTTHRYTHTAHVHHTQSHIKTVTQNRYANLTGTYFIEEWNEIPRCVCVCVSGVRFVTRLSSHSGSRRQKLCSVGFGRHPSSRGSEETEDTHTSTGILSIIYVHPHIVHLSNIPHTKVYVKYFFLKK